MLLARGGERLVRALQDPLRADVDPRAGGHLAEHRQPLRLEPAELVPRRPLRHEQRVRDQHARRVLVRREDADGLARLHEQRLVGAELEQRADDRAQRLVVARGLAGAAVDDELLRLLRDLGVEVVQQHAQRRLGRPLPRVQLRAARRADAREVAAQRLDARGECLGRAHRSSPISALGRRDERAVADRRRDRLDVAARASGRRAAAARARAPPPASRARRRRARAARGTRRPARRRAARSRAPRSQFASTCHAFRPAGVAHRHVILLAGARRDRVDRRRMAQHLVLRDERRGDVLRDHEAAVQPAVGREERRQAVGEVRVDEPLDAPLGDARELGDRHRERVERERERLAVEVAVRDERVVVDEHERIVGRRVELDRDGVVGVVEQVARRAVHLRRAAQRVRVLHLVAPAVRLDDRRAVEQAQHVRRRVALPAQRPQRVDLRQERRARALQRLERHRAREIGRLREPARAHEAERERTPP